MKISEINDNDEEISSQELILGSEKSVAKTDDNSVIVKVIGVCFVFIKSYFKFYSNITVNNNLT